MRPRIYIFVNGILTFPGLSHNWNRRAVTWVHVNTPHRAESLEYYIGPITRPFLDGYRARKLARKLGFYIDAGFELVLVGHSNGCDVVLDALRLLDWPDIHQVHLFSGACEADCELNGLNAALAGQRIGRVFNYVAEMDLALHLAATPIGRAFGFGILGCGAQGIPDSLITSNQFVEVRNTHFGHSTWFAGQHFAKTMERITRA